MNDLRKKQSLAKLALVAWFLFAFAGGEGVVLCFGDDGHVALEEFDGGKCCASPSSSESRQVTYSILPLKDVRSLSPCGSCTDVPLSAGKKAILSQPDRDNGSRHTHILHMTCPTYLTSCNKTALEASLSTTSISSDSLAALLSCTILLI